MAYEYNVVRNAKGENILNWLEDGWEILHSYQETIVEKHHGTEEIPQTHYITSNNSYNYNNNYNSQQRVYLDKEYPVAVNYAVFIMRRSAQAKVLYGQKDSN